MQIDFIINNKVSEQDFEKVVYEWLSEGDYTPDDIIENIITQNNLVLFPVYYFGTDYRGSCSVALGYQRQEFYQVWDNVNKRYVTQSKIVTDWLPHSQFVKGATVTVVYVGEALPDKIVSFVENMGWKRGELIKINDGYENHDKLISLFRYSKSEAWKHIAYERAFQKAAVNTSNELPSRLQRNLTLKIEFSETSFFSFLAPYWLFKYEYQDKLYYVVVDGNDPGRIDGIKPEDKRRKRLVNKLRWFGWFTGLLAILIALYFFSGEDLNKIEVNWLNFGIVATGLIFTGILVEYEVNKIKNKSKKIRSDLLNSRFKRLNN